MKSFGLPTYPINSGMIIGEREEDEIKWLLDYGDIRTPSPNHFKITRKRDIAYQLVKVIDNVEEIIEENTLQHFLKKINFEHWRWFEHEDSLS